MDQQYIFLSVSITLFHSSKFIYCNKVKTVHALPKSKKIGKIVRAEDRSHHYLPIIPPSRSLLFSSISPLATPLPHLPPFLISVSSKELQFNSIFINSPTPNPRFMIMATSSAAIRHRGPTDTAESSFSLFIPVKNWCGSFPRFEMSKFFPRSTKCLARSNNISKSLIRSLPSPPPSSKINI